MIIINWTLGILKKSNLARLLIFLFFILGFMPATRGGISADDKEVVSFVYHRFGDSRYPSTNISLEDFEAHLKYLKNNNFQVLTFSEAIEYLKSDTPPQKTVALTIDDGYKSFFENGLPLLKQYGFPATLFINTETIGSADYMDWESIKSAQAQGIEIGNHTHSHAYFLNMPAETRYINFKEEIKQTQKIIKNQLAVAPKVFAYPYGELDPQMKEIVRNSGFEAAAAQNSGVIHAGTDLMQCPRFPMSEYYSDIDKFKSKAQMNALQLEKQSPISSVLEKGTSSPVLTITLKNDNLQLEQLQCFIQSAECKISKSTAGNLTTLKLNSKSAIDHRRRTLYTVTVPDTDGKWHWFSHLWINPAIE